MTENDLLKSLEAFKNGKTPGTDDMNAELYIFLVWHKIISSSQYKLFIWTWHVIHSTKESYNIIITKERERPLVFKELETNIITKRRIQNFSKSLSQ